MELIINTKASWETLNNVNTAIISFKNLAKAPGENDWFRLEKYKIPLSEWNKAERIIKKQIAPKYISTVTYITGLDYIDDYDLGYIPEYFDIYENIKEGTSRIIDVNVDSNHIYIYRIMYGIYTGGESTESWNTYATNYVATKTSVETGDYSNFVDILEFLYIKNDINHHLLNHRYRGGIESSKWDKSFNIIERHINIINNEIENTSSQVDEKLNTVYNMEV